MSLRKFAIHLFHFDKLAGYFADRPLVASWKDLSEEERALYIAEAASKLPCPEHTTSDSLHGD